MSSIAITHRNFARPVIPTRRNAVPPGNDDVGKDCPQGKHNEHPRDKKASETRSAGSGDMFWRWSLQFFSGAVVVGNVVADGCPFLGDWRFVFLIVFLKLIHAALSLTKEVSHA